MRYSDLVLYHASELAERTHGEGTIGLMLHQVGVRELKDKLSAVLHRVQEGEPIEVTDNGRPIVRLVPIRPMSVTDRLVAEGTLVLAPDRDGEWPDPEPTSPGERPVSEIVIEMRADERY